MLPIPGDFNHENFQTTFLLLRFTRPDYELEK